MMKWFWDRVERIRAIIAYEGDPAAAVEAPPERALLRSVLPYLSEYLDDLQTCISFGGDDSAGTLAGKVSAMMRLKREIINCLGETNT